MAVCSHTLETKWSKCRLPGVGGSYSVILKAQKSLLDQHLYPRKGVTLKQPHRLKNKTTILLPYQAYSKYQVVTFRGGGDVLFFFLKKTQLKHDPTIYCWLAWRAHAVNIGSGDHSTPSVCCYYFKQDDSSDTAPGKEVWCVHRCTSIGLWSRDGTGCMSVVSRDQESCSLSCVFTSKQWGHSR